LFVYSFGPFLSLPLCLHRSWKRGAVREAFST
jgi:hypothetical protein